MDCTVSSYGQLSRDRSERHMQAHRDSGESRMNKLSGYIVAGLLATALAGCSNSSSGSESDATPSSSASSSPAATSSSPSEPESDEPGFLASATQHVASVGASDSDLVSLGKSVCDAYDRGAVTQDVVNAMKASMSPSQAVLFVRDW